MKDQKAVIYARYSSHNQRDVSIEQQVSACRKYASDNGLEVLRIYDDHAMTGTNDQRPEFQRMIRDSASGAFSFVIVYSLDRFSRDRYDSAVHKHTLKENGVKVLSAMENITDNPTGVLMESILEGFAEYYSKELAQKIRRGMLSNAQKGMVNGPLPFGYKKGSDGKYEVVPFEAEIIKEIYHRVADGEPFVRIIEDLNARGILTKGGKPWCHNSFSKMLSQEKYLGIYRYKDIVIEDGIPPIIDRALFDAVQLRLGSKPNRRNGIPQKRRREAGTYLLTGKLYCGHCESPMVGVSGKGKTGKPFFYYACKAHRADTRVCKKKPVPRDLIESRLASTLYTLISRQDVTDWLADATMDLIKEQQDSDEIRMLQARLDQIRKEKDNLLHAVRMAPAIQSLLTALGEAEAEESSVAAKLSLAQTNASSDITREDITAFIRDLTSGDVNDKAFQERLFDAFLVRAYVYDDHIRAVFAYTSGEEITIPFDISTADFPDAVEIPIDAECLYKHSSPPPKSPYTNTARVFCLQHLFVVVMPL